MWSLNCWVQLTSPRLLTTGGHLPALPTPAAPQQEAPAPRVLTAPSPALPRLSRQAAAPQLPSGRPPLAYPSQRRPEVATMQHPARPRLAPKACDRSGGKAKALPPKDAAVAGGSVPRNCIQPAGIEACSSTRKPPFCKVSKFEQDLDEYFEGIYAGCNGNLSQAVWVCGKGGVGGCKMPKTDALGVCAGRGGVPTSRRVVFKLLGLSPFASLQTRMAKVLREQMSRPAKDAAKKDCGALAMPSRPATGDLPATAAITCAWGFLTSTEQCAGWRFLES